jgi:hypothetical protein
VEAEEPTFAARDKNTATVNTTIETLKTPNLLWNKPADLPFLKFGSCVVWFSFFMIVFSCRESAESAQSDGHLRRPFRNSCFVNL